MTAQCHVLHLYYCTTYPAVTIGIEREEYSLAEGSTFDLCVVSTGTFDRTSSITVGLTSTPGSASGEHNVGM